MKPGKERKRESGGRGGKRRGDKRGKERVKRKKDLLTYLTIEEKVQWEEIAPKNQGKRKGKKRRGKKYEFYKFLLRIKIFPYKK